MFLSSLFSLSDMIPSIRNPTKSRSSEDIATLRALVFHWFVNKTTCLEVSISALFSSSGLPVECGCLRIIGKGYLNVVFSFHHWRERVALCVFTVRECYVSRLLKIEHMLPL